jgi:hypothetical protein
MFRAAKVAHDVLPSAIADTAAAVNSVGGLSFQVESEATQRLW